MTSGTSPNPPRDPDLSRIYAVPRWLVRANAIFPAASAVILFVMLVVPATYERAFGMLKEDRLVENLTFVAYFVAAFVGWAWVARRARRRASLGVTAGVALLALVSFGLGGEEISWGERAFHYQVPSLIRHANQQQEMTVHNLPEFQDLNNWFPLIFSVIAVLAVRYHTRPRRDRSGVPSLVLPYAWVIIVLNGYDNFTDWVPIWLPLDQRVGMLCELAEMLVAFGLMIGLWLASRREALDLAAGVDRPV